MSDGRVGGGLRAGVRISHICADCFLGLSVSAMVHMQASWWAVLVSVWVRRVRHRDSSADQPHVLHEARRVRNGLVYRD